MLGKQKIISVKESEEIIEGLNQIEKEIHEGNFQFRKDLEDIHMNVEARLTTLIGETGGVDYTRHALGMIRLQPTLKCGSGTR